MPETTLQDMSKKGNRHIKPRTKKNANIPSLVVQLNIGVDNRDQYPFVPLGDFSTVEIMNTDEILQRWLDSEIPEAYIYE